MRSFLVLSSCLFLATASSAYADEDSKPVLPKGVLPSGTDGKPLNLDFETGTLRDWTAESDA
jgi:hypothetical protein